MVEKRDIYSVLKYPAVRGQTILQHRVHSSIVVCYPVAALSLSLSLSVSAPPDKTRAAIDSPLGKNRQFAAAAAGLGVFAPSKSSPNMIVDILEFLLHLEKDSSVQIEALPSSPTEVTSLLLSLSSQ